MKGTSEGRSSSVTLVLSDQTPERLRELAGRTPVWIIGTPVNQATVALLWKERVPDVTSLRPCSGETLQDTLSRAVDAIGEHHVYDQLILVGVDSEDVPSELLADLGFSMSCERQGELFLTQRLGQQ